MIGWPQTARPVPFGRRDALCCRRHSIVGPGKGHKAYEGNRAHPRLTRCDFFDNGEPLWRVGRPQRHNEPTARFELLNQRRRDMVECASIWDRQGRRSVFSAGEAGMPSYPAAKL